MKLENLQLRQVLAICTKNKFAVFNNDDTFVSARSVCIWCKIKVYIGMDFMDVPEDLRAYFIDRHNYDDYAKIVEELSTKIRDDVF